MPGDLMLIALPTRCRLFSATPLVWARRKRWYPRGDSLRYVKWLIGLDLLPNGEQEI